MSKHVITIPIKCSTLKTLANIVFFLNPVVLFLFTLFLIEKWWNENEIMIECKKEHAP